MKRVALYVRVSTEEQKKEGLSVDSQIEALTQYAKENKYKIVEIYNDAGISARKSYKKRPALQKLLADCEADKIDLILFTRLDRWFRSVGDYYEVQQRLEAVKVPWKTIWEDYETITSSGVFKVNIMLSVAQSEADRTSERIKKVFDYKRARGEALTGKAPTGYYYKEGKCYKDEKTQKGVEAFFNTYLLTYNKKLSISKAKELGVHISDETARAMLYGNNYHGIVPYITEAYITKEEHDKILANKPVCSRNNKYDYIFTGLLICGKCKKPLSASTSVNVRKKSGKSVAYPMYVCDYGRRNYACTGSAISEAKLEKMLLDNLDEELNKYNISLTLDNNNDCYYKIAKCKDKLKRLKILFELGDIELEEYINKKTLVIEEITALEATQDKKPVHIEANWQELYSKLDKNHKNAFWRNIIDFIEIPTKKATEIHIKFK